MVKPNRKANGSSTRVKGNNKRAFKTPVPNIK